MIIDVDKVAQRIRELVNGYLLRFGLAYVGLYRFTDMAQIPDWATYLSVMNTTLNREGMRPIYLWLRNGGNDVLLLLCISGYFRSGMNDVTDIMQRLWMLRTSCCTLPVLMKEWQTDSANVETVINGIYQVLGNFSFMRQHAYRKHGFGSSTI